MAKNVLFLVHGVGHHAEGWTAEDDGPIPTLSTAAKHYDGFSEDDPLDNSVEFVEIRYDDIFDKILSQWSELATDLENASSVTPDEIKSVTDRLQEVDNPDNWFATEAMDVLFYVGFKLVRRLVQLRVASKIMNVVASHDAEEGRRYSILSHSLGTTVAHDAIHRMGTTNWLTPSKDVLEILNGNQVGDVITLADLERARRRYGERIFSPGNFKFDAIFMISNTSRLLHQAARNPFEGIVRPRFSGGGLGTNACLRFYNIDHILDPISKVRRFRAKEAWSRSSMEGTAFDVDVEHIHDANVHALEHYLVNPLVHGPILRSVARKRFSWADQTQANGRVEPGGNFPRWGEKYRDEDFQENVMDALEAIRVRGNRKALAQLLVAFPKVIDDLRTRADQ